MELESPVYYRLGTIDSTNTWAKSHAHELATHRLSVIVANEQIAGRGRMGRPWVSPPSLNLYVTFFFLLPDYAQIDRLAQLLAFSASRALDALGLSIWMKWPNDLMIGKKKLAGTLCETTPLADGIGVAAGIGLNVNMTQEDLAEVDQPATSLCIEKGAPQDREALLLSLTTAFDADLTRFRKEGFIPFEESLRNLLKQR